MTSYPSSPVPPLTGKWQFVFQTDFFSARGDGQGQFTIDACGALARSIEEVCHRFGVTVRSGRVTCRGAKIFTQATLVAGEWSHEWRGATTVSGHPVGRLCARILRLLERENENLG